MCISEAVSIEEIIHHILQLRAGLIRQKRIHAIRPVGRRKSYVTDICFPEASGSRRPGGSPSLPQAALNTYQLLPPSPCVSVRKECHLRANSDIAEDKTNNVTSYRQRTTYILIDPQKGSHATISVIAWHVLTTVPTTDTIVIIALIAENVRISCRHFFHRHVAVKDGGKMECFWAGK